MNLKQSSMSIALFAASSVAFAFSGEFQTADAGFASAKTRAQVIQELKQAQADGSYQTLQSEYQDSLAWSAQRVNPASPQAPVIAGKQLAGSQVKAIALADGTAVYVFDDGKMGMEDRYGRATQMAPGHSMTTRDGRIITMVGNEVARVDALLNAEYPGGR